MAPFSKITAQQILQKPLQRKADEEAYVEKAAFAHFMHNSMDAQNVLYKNAAVNFTRRFLKDKYPKENITKSISEKLVKQFQSEFKSDVPFPTPINHEFTFIDLFAGIGGFRMAMQQLGGKCVFTSEWDKQAQKTYAANYGKIPFGDITKEITKTFVPDNFDVLCAGFPCQAFSIAGKRSGFEDTRGTLFFEVAEIIRRKKPKAIFLENVKGLINHKNGNTLSTILHVLRNDLGYYVPEPRILNAKNFGLPQNRERIFIVGFRKDLGIDKFTYPKGAKTDISFADVKEKKPVSARYYLSSNYFNTLKEHKERHKNRGNGFGYEIIPDDCITNAVVCGGMGRERNLIYDDRITDFKPVTAIRSEINREYIRRMTPREWARLQGYPDEFIIKVSDAAAYKQFGNSVAVPVIKAVGKKIIEKITR